MLSNYGVNLNYLDMMECTVTLNEFSELNVEDNEITFYYAECFILEDDMQYKHCISLRFSKDDIAVNAEMLAKEYDRVVIVESKPIKILFKKTGTLNRITEYNKV